MIRLPYFKFFPSEWLSGNINYEDYHIQGLFINLCAHYWAKGCKLTLKEAQGRLRDSYIDSLIDKNFVKIVDGNIVIEFLDEQFSDLSETRHRQSLGGRKGGLRSAQGKLKHKEEDKEEDKDKDKDSKPTLEEFIRYGYEELRVRGYRPENFKDGLIAKYRNWEQGGWKHQAGSQKGADIKNWKSKLNNTLQYIPETKVPNKTPRN